MGLQNEVKSLVWLLAWSVYGWSHSYSLKFSFGWGWESGIRSAAVAVAVAEGGGVAWGGGDNGDANLSSF